MCPLQHVLIFSHIIFLCTELLWTTEIRTDDGSTFVDLSWLSYKPSLTCFSIPFSDPHIGNRLSIGSSLLVFFKIHWKNKRAFGKWPHLPEKAGSVSSLFMGVSYKQDREVDVPHQSTEGWGLVLTWKATCFHEEPWRRWWSWFSDPQDIGKPGTQSGCNRKVVTKRWERARTACVAHFR